MVVEEMVAAAREVRYLWERPRRSPNPSLSSPSAAVTRMAHSREKAWLGLARVLCVGQ